MPSGFELKPTRLMPLMERSECREVLLVEWGAPAREACIKYGGRRTSCLVHDETWPCMGTGSGSPLPRDASTSPPSKVLRKKHCPAHSAPQRDTQLNGFQHSTLGCIARHPGTQLPPPARFCSWSLCSAHHFHYSLRHLDKHKTTPSHLILTP